LGFKNIAYTPAGLRTNEQTEQPLMGARLSSIKKAFYALKLQAFGGKLYKIS